MATMIPRIVATEGRKFLETTTIRGVQRIMKTKSRVLFVFWLLAVLTAFGLLLWQLSAVFMRYMKYPVNTLYVQSPDYENATFPDITICNLCPLVHESDMSLRYTDYVNDLSQTLTFDEVVKRYASQGIGNNTASQFVFELFSLDLKSPASYFRNFPISAFQMADNENSPVLDCGYFNWDYSPSENYNCMSGLKAIWDPDYYKCYTSKLSKSERKNVRGFSAIFYIENYLESAQQLYGLDLRNPQSTGMQVMIHPPGTIPDMKLGISISPGMRTSIVLDQTIRTQQPAPYSNCTTQTTYGSNTTTYTQQYCIDVCKQNLYIKKCRCLESTLQYTAEQLQQVNGTMCGNLSVINASMPLNWAGLDQYVCSYFDIDDSAIQSCTTSCVPPCQEFRYTTSVSAAPWPHISSLISFYVTYIKYDPQFGTLYDEYDRVYEMISSNASYSKQLLQKLNSERLIQDSFAQLDIRFNSHIYNEQKDVVAIPPETLGSQIGGVLSLWLGVTIMVVFELCEFLVTVIVTCYQAKKDRSLAVTETTTSKV